MIQRSYSLTFSRRNQHIKRILEQKRTEGEIISDYVCRAIEFYEKYKDVDFSNNINLNNLDSDYVTRREVRNLVNDCIRDFFAGTISKNTNENYIDRDTILLTRNSQNNSQVRSVEMPPEPNKYNLENNINNININED